MSEAVVDDIVAVLPPLLQSLESLGFVARHLNPPDFGRVMEAAGTPDEALRAVRPRLAQWPEEFSGIRTALETSSDAALASFDGLRAVQNGHGDLVSVFKALRYAPRAQEALYALSAKLPPVSEFFVDPDLREDADLMARLAAPANDDTGIFHDHNESGSRGGFSLYVPEYYTPDRAWPLVMALHGGSGNGRGFLWSWLRDARSRGAILIAPTATGQPPDKTTWALMGDDTDTPNLMRILEQVRSRWNVDADQDAADRHERRRHLLLRDGIRKRLALHPSGAGIGDLSPADGGNGRCRTAARAADSYRARQARLDVSGAGGAADQPSAVGGRRRRHLSRTRRPQPLLSARDERGDFELAQPSA